MKKFNIIWILCLTAIVLSGCGVKTSHKSPEGVVKSIVNAYQYGDEKAVKKSFGLDPKKKCDSAIQEEINYNLTFYKAHKAKDVSFKKCASLGNFNGYSLVYVIYDYEIKTKKELMKAPAISIFFVQKKDKKYYVVPNKDITPEMAEISKKEYAKFVKKKEYESYETSYKEFIGKNKEYEKTVSAELESLLKK